jgi:hypothetical protein
LIATWRRWPPSVRSPVVCLPRQPPRTSVDLGFLGVVGSAAGESAKLDTGSRLVKTTRCSTSKSSDHNSPTRSPTSVHVVMVYKCSTNRRRRFLVRRLRRSPLNPPGRPGRATAAVAAVAAVPTTIDETNTRRVPTRPIRRVPRPCSMVVLPYLPSPLARSIPSDQTDRTAPPSFRQHKTRSSLCFVFQPPPRLGDRGTPSATHKRSVDGSGDRPAIVSPNLTRKREPVPDARLPIHPVPFNGLFVSERGAPL